jgi:hypothetical protein
MPGRRRVSVDQHDSHSGAGLAVGGSVERLGIARCRLLDVLDYRDVRDGDEAPARDHALERFEESIHLLLFIDDADENGIVIPPRQCLVFVNLTVYPKAENSPVSSCPG